MTVKLGRNDPCPCGSGKKYKKCHLAADEARQQDPMPSPATDRTAGPVNPVPDRPIRAPEPLPVLSNPAPEQRAGFEAGDAFWKRWNSASYEERLALFAEELAAGVPHDAFDLMESLFQDTRANHDRDRFWSLVEQLREAAPDVAEQEQIWLLSWLVEDAVTRRLYDRLPTLVEPLAEVAPLNIDEAFRLLDMLLFHGQTDPAIAIMARAWPAVSVTPGITPYGLGEYVGLLSMLRIADYAARTPDPRPDDPALLALLNPLGVLDQEGIALALGALTGPARAWTADDFKHDPGAHDRRTAERRPEEQGRDEAEFADIDELLRPAEGSDEDLEALLNAVGEPVESEDGGVPAPVTVSPVGQMEAGQTCVTLNRNLVTLSLECAVELARTSGLPFSRIELGRDVLVTYLSELPPGRHDRAMLLPDRRSVGDFTTAYLSPLSGRYYKGAAFFSLLPRYIAAVEARGLVSRDLARRSRNEVLRLQEDVLRICRQAVDDPLLHQYIEQAGE